MNCLRTFRPEGPHGYGSLGFPITSHTSWTEHSRSLPPGRLTSTDGKENPLPQDWEKDSLTAETFLVIFTFYHPNTNGKNHPPLYYVLSRARQSAHLLSHAPNQQNQAMVLQSPNRAEPGTALPPLPG